MSRIRDMLNDINKDNWKKIVQQFIKFGIVGISNTLISTAVYYVFVWISPKLYMVGNVFGWIISVFNSFVWNNHFVFKDSSFPWWKKLLRTYMAYGGSFIVGSVTLMIIVSGLHISAWLAPWLNLIITVPLNFILNKFWAYKA